MEEQEILNVVEFFGGIGAIRKALIRQNIPHKVLDYVEIDEFAVKSYNAMFDEHFEPQDISQWDKDLPVDLIMHGSPCQDFSIAGLQAGGDEGSGTRSSLMYETIRIVKKLKPKYVIWENVKNLVSDKHYHNFDNYLNIMDEIGYNNYYQVLNSKDYGVPQNRERVFTVSIRKDIDDRYFYFPEKQTLTLRLKDLLEESVDEKYYLSDDKISSISQWKAYQKPLEAVLGQNSITPTLTARGAGEEHAGMITYSEDFEETTNIQKELEHQHTKLDGVIAHNIPQIVRVRKYIVDTDKLQVCLIEAKENVNLTNKEIATQLDVPQTQVEHYFRTDNSFAIPSDDIWPKLKELLKIETDEFDQAIMTYEEKQSNYDMNNRVYDSYGVAPTLKTSEEKIIEYKGKEVELPAICASRGRNLENPNDRTPGQKLEQTIEVNTDGVSNTLTTFQKDNYVLEENKELKYVGSIKDKDIVGDGKSLSRNASMGDRVYDSDGVSATISAQGGGVGGHSGLYTVDNTQKEQAAPELYIEGNYKPSGHACGNIYNTKGISPTVMENHGAAVAILEDNSDKDIDNPLKGISGQSWQFEQNVYSEDSKCIRTLKAGEGSGNIPKIIESTEPSEMQQIADELNKDAKHQQDLIQTEDGLARTIVAGSHGNTSSYTKTIVSEATNRIIEHNPNAKHQHQLVQDEEGISRCVLATPHATTGDHLKTLVRENADRNKKEQLCDYMVENNLVEEYDVINHGYTEHRFETIGSGKDIVMAKNMAPTITTRPDELGVTVNKTKNTTGLRIRKLTPKECWRLMGFDDEDFDRAEKVNSNAQLYKQAGNSIVVNVLEAILHSLFNPDTSKPRRRITKKLF